jgi:hypothetical protein
VQDMVRTIQKGGFEKGVDGISYFHWFSVILFDNQNHPNCIDYV